MKRSGHMTFTQRLSVLEEWSLLSCSSSSFLFHFQFKFLFGTFFLKVQGFKYKEWPVINNNITYLTWYINIVVTNPSLININQFEPL